MPAITPNFLPRSKPKPPATMPLSTAAPASGFFVYSVTALPTSSANETISAVRKPFIPSAEAKAKAPPAPANPRPIPSPLRKPGPLSDTPPPDLLSLIVSASA